MSSVRTGPNWPAGGEIDIVEGVNTYTNNQATIHTNPGCTIPSSNSTVLGITGDVTGGTNCAAAETGNAGCGIRSTSNTSYGVGFNELGGGVYASAFAILSRTVLVLMPLIQWNGSTAAFPFGSSLVAPSLQTSPQGRLNPLDGGCPWRTGRRPTATRRRSSTSTRLSLTPPSGKRSGGVCIRVLCLTRSRLTAGNGRVMCGPTPGHQASPRVVRR